MYENRGARSGRRKLSAVVVRAKRHCKLDRPKPPLGPTTNLCLWLSFGILRFFCFASGTLNSYERYEPKIHSHQRGTAQNLGLYMHACTTYITYTYSIYTERNGHKGLLPQRANGVCFERDIVGEFYDQLYDRIQLKILLNL